MLVERRRELVIPAIAPLGTHPPSTRREDSGACGDFIKLLSVCKPARLISKITGEVLVQDQGSGLDKGSLIQDDWFNLTD